MRYFLISLIVCLLTVNAGECAYLPVVDVSSGTVSARAMFGEEIAPQKSVAVAPLQKTNTKKVVARSAKKQNLQNNIASVDVLKPNRPSSDLWARGAEAPLRMPRMDEIAVINSDVLLPEESLDEKPVMLAQNSTPSVVQRAASDETANELKLLRAEIAKLSKMQQETENKIARARPVAVRTPISGNANVAPAADKVAEKSLDARSVNVRREVVPAASETAARVAVNNSVAEPKFASVNEMSKMSPSELKKAFKKTYLSENKHLSTYQMDNRYDEVSDMSASIEGFSAQRDLSEIDAGVRPLEIKISFLNGDSGLSRENYNLLSETASIVVNNPKRAIQIAIPESATQAKDARKLASRRLAIIEQVLRDTGVSEQRIVPVLSQRDGDEFVLRIISGDTFETLNRQKRNMFGDTVSNKTYKSMSW